MASQDFSRTTASPEQNKPGAPMADRVGQTYEGCLFVLELRFNCKSFFSIFLARYHRRSPSVAVQKSASFLGLAQFADF
jgi:hypothetical protein